jgi:hypothetical protein
VALDGDNTRVDPTVVNWASPATRRQLDGRAERTDAITLLEMRSVAAISIVNEDAGLASG